VVVVEGMLFIYIFGLLPYRPLTGLINPSITQQPLCILIRVLGMHSLDDRLSFEFKGIGKKKNYGILPDALAYKP
jgi:hypothetical protein